MYGLNLLNTLISCQWNSRRSLVAISSLCFLWPFSKLSTFFKRYSINFNFATMTEWNHSQLVFLLYRDYPSYKSINHSVDIRGVNPSDLTINKNSVEWKKMCTWFSNLPSVHSSYSS